MGCADRALTGTAGAVTVTFGSASLFSWECAPQTQDATNPASMAPGSLIITRMIGPNVEIPASSIVPVSALTFVN
jgi:hypothetical protein